MDVFLEVSVLFHMTQVWGTNGSKGIVGTGVVIKHSVSLAAVQKAQQLRALTFVPGGLSVVLNVSITFHSRL